MTENINDINEKWNQVTIVSVTHNSGLVIDNFIDSQNDLAKVIVVDNASTDNTLDIISNKRPSTFLVKNKIGIGYGNGCNAGLALVETPFALLANPDSVSNDAAIEVLLAAAHRYPGAGLIGPTVINGDGSVELSHDVELWKRKGYPKRERGDVPEGEICAEFVSGAVVLVRMEAMRDIGGFDPEFFLYYEDDDMCMNLRRHGWWLMLVPAATVMHIGGGSVRVNRHYFWEKFWNIAWSRLHIERKYHGRFAMTHLAIFNIIKFALKSMGYGLLANADKAWRDLARSAGSFAALFGMRSSKLPRRVPRNE